MRVLVVEDELRIAALLKRGLQEDGYAVDVVSTGRTRSDRRPSSPTTPSCSTSCCRAWTASSSADSSAGPVGVPVLMLTAPDAVEDRVRGLDAGADYYLTKPFSFAELSARVRR